MNKEQRLLILERFAQLAHKEDENVEFRARAFLPLPMHRLALRREKVVVLGGRGAGKSALFRLLTLERKYLLDFFGDDLPEAATWVNGFSDDEKIHPQPPEIDALAASPDNERLRLFWMSHLLTVLLEKEPGLVDLPDELRALLADSRETLVARIAALMPSIGLLTRALDVIDDRLAKKNRTLFVAYDQIDRLGAHDTKKRARLAGTLLSMWLTLSNRYRNLRAKVFLRHDVFEDSQRVYADATKLAARAVSLDWDVESLFRVVARHLANDVHGDPVGLVETREWLSGIDGMELRTSKLTGWMPGEISSETQRCFGIALAGEYMGSGPTKGRTYKWIVNHLQDANLRVVPRSMLSLLGLSAHNALKAPPARGVPLMTPTLLAGALAETSRARVTEIGEEYKVVQRIRNLANESVLLDRKVTIDLLARLVPGEEAGLPGDGEIVLDELCRLGVLKIREDGRIDVPDIYRYGYGIKRKGGVKQAR